MHAMAKIAIRGFFPNRTTRDISFPICWTIFDIPRPETEFYGGNVRGQSPSLLQEKILYQRVVRGESPSPLREKILYQRVSICLSEGCKGRITQPYFCIVIFMYLDINIFGVMRTHSKKLMFQILPC
jgi:hypothetical protein